MIIELSLKICGATFEVLLLGLPDISPPLNFRYHTGVQQKVEVQ